MAEHLNVPAESWRGQRRASVIDPQIVRLGLFAACGLVILGLGFAGYSWLGHRSHGVPVVEADPRPIRVRPDNPGGMQVVGAEELSADGSGPDAMAPPPEAPAPQALRAKIAAETHPAVPSAPPVSAPAVLPPVPASPAPQAEAAPAAKPAPPAAPRSGAQVQLAAFGAEQAAKTEALRLSRRMPDLLAAHPPAVERAEHDGRVIYRLRTGGFADVAAATSFCVQVRSRGANCSIANF